MIGSSGAQRATPARRAGGLWPELWAVARLDLADVRRSRWMVLCVVVYALLAVGFVLIGMRESSVLGFSGMGRMLLSMIHALLLLLPLLGLTATGQVINRARDDGTLELVFSHPVRRGVYFAAVTLTRYLVLVLPLVVVMVAMALVGRVAFGEEIRWQFLFQSLGICASLLAAFVGLGLMVSTFVRSQARAVIWLLVLWALGVALVDFGLIGVMLQWRVNAQTVFLLAALNPVQAARMALLSGASAELSALGPVGFYLANQVGAGALLALGLVWPALVGLASWAIALRSFRRTDIV
ncbi:MAG: ABC transporter permease subunit [Deltaproteobacteria bacterium]|nr:ABC transporter permease subunit [Deltaproteobacteria bacterium]